MEIDIKIHSRTGDGDVITLQQDLIVVWRDRTLLIPAGFQSDGASVPQFLWSSVSPAIDPRTIRAAIVHDYLYRTAPAGWTRKDADDLFYDFCRQDGLSWWKSQKAYWGVRCFGGSAWRGAA